MITRQDLQSIRPSGRTQTVLQALNPLGQAAAVMLALGTLAGGCGDDGPMGTDSGGGSTTLPPPASVQGYAVDCDPSRSGLSKICMSPGDWMCPHEGYYVREAVCAFMFGGTPSDWNNKPTLVEVDGSYEIDCADLPTGYVDVSGLGVQQCDDCQVCGLQVLGKNEWVDPNGPPPDPPQWEELAYCPSTLPGVDALCNPTPTTGDPTEGDPTEGDPTEGDPTEGPGGSGIWICNGTPTICAKKQEDDILPDWEIDVCMSGNTPDCVNATSESTARQACSDLCDLKNEQYEKEAKDNGTHWTSFHCADLYNYLVPPVEATDPFNQCSGHGPMENARSSFVALAELDFFGGANASSDQLGGLLDFQIGTCSSGSCQFSLNELRAWTDTVQGIYNYQDTSNNWQSIPFEISGLEVILLQPAVGVYSTSTSDVTFPTQNMYAIISSSSSTLNGSALNDGFHEVPIVISGAAGSYSGGTLELELEWATPDGFLQFSMNLTAG